MSTIISLMSLNPWMTCHKKAVRKIDECVEAIPKGDDDDAVPKVKCNEEDILTEDVNM